MAPTAIFAQSTQYVDVAVSAYTDPTLLPVAFAFLGPYASSQQANSAVVTASTPWYEGSWTATTYYPTLYNAQCLVGPAGTVSLISGSYLVCVKITGTSESPVLWAGPLVVS